MLAFPSEQAVFPQSRHIGACIRNNTALKLVFRACSAQAPLTNMNQVEILHML